MGVPLGFPMNPIFEVSAIPILQAHHLGRLLLAEHVVDQLE
jgi:hypothetical protein